MKSFGSYLGKTTVAAETLFRPTSVCDVSAFTCCDAVENLCVKFAKTAKKAFPALLQFSATYGSSFVYIQKVYGSNMLFVFKPSDDIGRHGAQVEPGSNPQT